MPRCLNVRKSVTYFGQLPVWPMCWPMLMMGCLNTRQSKLDPLPFMVGSGATAALQWDSIPTPILRLRMLCFYFGVGQITVL